MREIALVDAMREALQEEMERDERVFVMGSGARVSIDGSTAGLFERFGPQRVLDVPVAEGACAGIAAGAALGGLRPVLRVGNLGFSLTLMDQLTNEAAKIHYKFNGQLCVPAVYCFDTAHRGWGVHHSQAIYAAFSHLPGLKVVVPSTPYDAKGLLKQAIRDDNPVLYTVHRDQYSDVGTVPDGEFTVEIGKASVVREGTDVSVVTCGWFVARALEAANRLGKRGVSVEVIDLRTLVPLDWETLTAAAKKTGRVVVYDQGPLNCGTAVNVAAGIQRRAFRSLKAPVIPLASEDAPVPYSFALENAVVPTVERLLATIEECLSY